MSDYLPRPDGDLINWLTHFSSKLSARARALGVPPEDIEAMTASIAAYLTTHNNTEAARTAAQSALANRAAAKSVLISAVRQMVRAIKANRNYTDEIGADLDVVGETPAFDPNSYKPVITGQAVRGQIRIEFKRLGVDALNIYSRLKGQTSWTFLGRDTYAPYVDTKPLAQPNQPETREYLARGVIGDAEVGLDSDIVPVVYGG